MKKVLAIALIAASFAACNNKAEKKETPADSVKTETPVENTPVTVDSTTTPAPDSVQAPM